MKIISVVIFLVLYSSSSVAGELAVGKISSLRTHTSSHSNNAVVGHTTFKISTNLTTPCTTLFLGPSDKTALSFLLSAKAQKEEIKIYYRTDLLASWSNVTCSVYAVDIP